MLAVNYTNLRENMKNYMDKVTDDYETMIVTRKNNRNVVMMSEEAYNNLMENLHVIEAEFLRFHPMIILLPDSFVQTERLLYSTEYVFFC